MKLTFTIDEADLDAIATLLASKMSGSAAPKASKPKTTKSKTTPPPEDEETEEETEAEETVAGSKTESFEESNEEATPTMAEVREVLSAVQKKFDHEKAMGLLTKIPGVKGLTSLKPENFAEVIAAGNKLLKK